MMLYTDIKFQVHGDERGSLIALEELKEIPFVIKRIYYIYGTREGVRRGFHAHRKLKQVLVCLNGSCKILLDDGYKKETVFLQENDRGIYIDRPIWREMFDFSPDAVLLCIASDIYNESDYIRNYEEFLEYIGRKDI